MEKNSSSNYFEEDNVELGVDSKYTVDKNGYRKNTNIFSKAERKPLNTSVKVGKCMKFTTIKKSTLDVLKNMHDFNLPARRAETIFMTYLLYNDILLFKGGKPYMPEPLFYEKIMRPYFYKVIRELYVSCIFTTGYARIDIVKVEVYDSVKNRYVTFSVPQIVDRNSGEDVFVQNMNTNERDLKFVRNDENLIKKIDEFYYDPNVRFIVQNYPSTDEDNLKKFMDGEIKEMQIKIPLECQLKPLIRYSKYMSDKNDSNSKLTKESNNPKLIVQNKAPLKDEEMKNFMALYNNTEYQKPTDFLNALGLNNFKEKQTYERIQADLVNGDECINNEHLNTLINKNIDVDTSGTDVFSVFQRAKKDGTGVYDLPRIIGKNEIFEFSPFQEYKGLLDTKSQYIDTIAYENFVNARYCEVYGMPETSLTNKIVSTAEINSETSFMEKTADSIKFVLSHLVSELFNIIYPDRDGSGEFTVEFQTTPETDMASLIELYRIGLLGENYMHLVINRMIDPGFDAESDSGPGKEAMLDKTNEKEINKVIDKKEEKEEKDESKKKRKREEEKEKPDEKEKKKKKSEDKEETSKKNTK
jgi:hypothetical protein